MATTLTLQPDGTAGQDARIRSDDPNGNDGDLGTFAVGEYNTGASVRRTLIKFDLSSLPANAVISSAVLSIYSEQGFADNASTIAVYRVKRAWVEAQVTWNIYSTGNSWQTAGGFGANDCEQDAIGTLDLTAAEANGFKAITLTPTTKAALDLGNGWMIKSTTENNDGYQYSSSDSAAAGQRPKLVITYTIKSSGGLIRVGGRPRPL